MKIDNSAQPVGANNPADVKTRAPNASGGVAESNSPATSVNLSSVASGLHKAENIIANTPVVDRAKVDAIKSAIADGSFKMDSHKVADGLIREVRDMLSAQQA